MKAVCYFCMLTYFLTTPFIPFMLIIKLFGGLGNQIFQYALGRHLALKNNIPLFLDTFSGFQDDFYQRNYTLDIFKIPANIADKNLIEKINRLQNPLGRKDKFQNWLTKNIFQFNPLFINGKHFQYDPEIFHLQTKFAYVSGYWQTEKYFKEIENTIRQDLTFVNPISSENQDLKAAIQESNSVCLHVRRLLGIAEGKINADGVKFHGSASLDYYSKALNIITQQEQQPHFFVFADEPAWAKENIKLPYPTTFVEGNADFEDLQLMSLCKHHIIANSSFSWWAAWLNANPEKIVIMPKAWFADQSVNTSDVCPVTWLSI